MGALLWPMGAQLKFLEQVVRAPAQLLVSAASLREIGSQAE